MNEIVDAKRHRYYALDIAAALDEQSRGIVQVSQAISEMDKVTQQKRVAGRRGVRGGAGFSF